MDARLYIYKYTYISIYLYIVNIKESGACTVAPEVYKRMSHFCTQVRPGVGCGDANAYSTKDIQYINETYE